MTTLPESRSCMGKRRPTSRSVRSAALSAWPTPTAPCLERMCLRIRRQQPSFCRIWKYPQVSYRNSDSAERYLHNRRRTSGFIRGYGRTAGWTRRFIGRGVGLAGTNTDVQSADPDWVHHPLALVELSAHAAPRKSVEKAATTSRPRMTCSRQVRQSAPAPARGAHTAAKPSLLESERWEAACLQAFREASQHS